MPVISWRAYPLRVPAERTVVCVGFCVVVVGDVEVVLHVEQIMDPPDDRVDEGRKDADVNEDVSFVVELTMSVDFVVPVELDVGVPLVAVEVDNGLDVVGRDVEGEEPEPQSPLRFDSLVSGPLAVKATR
jgi:hypothetical protein